MVSPAISSDTYRIHNRLIISCNKPNTFTSFISPSFPKKTNLVYGTNKSGSPCIQELPLCVFNPNVAD